MTTTVTAALTQPSSVPRVPIPSLLPVPSSTTTIPPIARLDHHRPRADRGTGNKSWLSRVSVYGMLAFIALFSADVERLLTYRHHRFLSSSASQQSSQIRSPSCASPLRSIRAFSYGNIHRLLGREQEYIQEHGHHFHSQGYTSNQRRHWPARMQNKRHELQDQEQRSSREEEEQAQRQRRGMGLMPSILCHAATVDPLEEGLLRMFGDFQEQDEPERESAQEVQVESNSNRRAREFKERE